MNGATVLSSALLPEDPSWVPIRTADFDGDGKADLLMRKGDGGHATWLMQGTTTVAAKTDVLAAGTGWEANP